MSEQEVFLAAVEISDMAARLAYLDQACAGDPALRQQVEALLKVHDTAGDFLATPAMQQLPGQPASSAVENAQAMSDAGEFEKTSRYAHDPQGHDDEVPLRFLSPSTKPGSLGQMGHYEVLEILGHGAFGIVLKAFDEKLHRIVAIKVMSPELASTSPPRKRFLREARASAAIRHENVVAVHAVEEQPIPYMVMEYIPGLTLHRALEEHGPLDVADVLRIGQQIANGLAAAHAQGLIHRDIKPANILLENGLTGRVKISDFGLARAADDASLTQSGTIAGTPMYMSPEQATTGQIDQRSDLFSLGSVMYVMVSGRPPFRAPTTLAVLRRVVEDTPRPIPEIIANVPSWLCAIITKLHAKQPADRFATASEVGELLGRCLADLQANRPIQLPVELMPAPAPIAAPIPVEPVVVQRDVPKPHRRETDHQRRWPTIAAILLLLFVGLGLSEATGVTQLTSTVIRLTTGSGILVIETDDPEIKVTIDGELVQIQGAGVEQLSLKPGKYQVAAVKDGTPISPQLVTIARGGKEVVRVTMEGIAGVDTSVRRDPTRDVQATADPDRRAAEWVLMIGGRIAIKANGREHLPTALSDLPTGRFELTGVTLAENQHLSNAGLTVFENCRNLESLDLQSTAVSDQGLNRFRNCPKLKVLNLGWCPKISDAGLVAFKNCKLIKELTIQGQGDQVTDAGLANFHHCQQLTSLFLQGIHVSDAGLANFRNCSQLQSLYLQSPNISDAGLEYFQNCTELTALGLHGTPVQDTGLAHFRNCKKLTTLSLESPHITDAGLKHFDASPDLTWVTVKCARVSDAGLAMFQGCPNLKSLVLDGTQVSDARLPQLAALTNLTQLSLARTNVTETAIQTFSTSMPRCRVIWDGGVIEPRSPILSAKPLIAGLLKAGVGFDVIDPSQTRRWKLASIDELAAGDLVEGLRINGTAVADPANVELLKRFPAEIWRKEVEYRVIYLNGPFSPERLQVILAIPAFQSANSLFLEGGGASMPESTFADLVRFTEIGSLAIAGTSVSDKVLKTTIAAMPRLKWLALDRTKVTNSGLVILRDRPLRELQLQSCVQIDDTAADHVAAIPTLEFLLLNGTSITDAGLAKLSTLTKLKSLNVFGTKVTEEGVKKLAAAIPQCQIHWAGGVIEPSRSGDGWQGWPKAAPPPAVAPFNVEQAKKHQEAWAAFLNVPVEYTNSIGMKFRLIPPGEFQMGSTQEEMKTALAIWANDAPRLEMVESAFPRHRVILTQPFYFGIHEVTQAEYEQVTGKNPSYFTSLGAGKDAITGTDTSRHPVDSVSWNDAVEFCAKLSPQEELRPFYALRDDRKIPQALDGNGYRLPTEAEWEFACRAGTATKYWNGDSDEDVVPCGWMAVNAAGRTHQVGELKANPFGLYDVHGNVWEWMHGWWGITAYQQHQDRAAVDPTDHFAGRQLRVIRGGAWSSSPYCPGWFRGTLPATTKEHAAGIRVVLPVDAVRQSLKRTGPDLVAMKTVPADPDSVAAEYVLSIGGTIGVKEIRVELPSETTDKVVRRAFELTSVDLTSNPLVSDAGLEHFQNCEHVTELKLSQTKVSNAGMVNFNAFQNLTVLELGDTAVGDEGLAHFQNCKNLRFLTLSYCGRVNDAGLAYFKDCRKLETLNLTHTGATDAGLANFHDCKELTILALEGIQKLSDAGLVHFKNCRKLKRLLLAGTSIDGTGLANFSDCEKLDYLDLNGTKVSDASLANFKNCRHITTLLLNSPDMTDAGLVNFQECRDLVVLNINSPQIGNAGLEYFKDCKELVHLSLVGTHVSDAGLAHLKGCKNLELLRLKHLSVGDVGLGYFKDCKRLLNVDLMTTAVSDASLADLANLPNLTELNLEWTRISLRGYEQLKAALPKCQMSWSEVNRNVAENVLALGGSVEIGVPGQQESRPIQVTADLPDNFFQVRRVSLAGVAKPLQIVQQNLFWLDVPEFDRLERLDLSGVIGFDYSVLGRVHGLQELSLVKSGLNDKSLENLPKLPTLRRLVLDGNAIAGPGMSALEKQSTLIELSLVNAGLNDLSLAQLPKLPELKRLVLDGNEIRGGGIAVLKTQPELIDLSLGCPTLTDLTARQLTELKQLTRLSLAGSSLTDVGIKHLAGLTNLESLDLRRTKATAAGINELKAALPKCEIPWDGMQDK